MAPCPSQNSSRKPPLQRCQSFSSRAERLSFHTLYKRTNKRNWHSPLQKFFKEPWVWRCAKHAGTILARMESGSLLCTFTVVHESAEKKRRTPRGGRGSGYRLDRGPGGLSIRVRAPRKGASRATRHDLHRARGRSLKWTTKAKIRVSCQLGTAARATLDQGTERRVL